MASKSSLSPRSIKWNNLICVKFFRFLNLSIGNNNNNSSCIVFVLYLPVCEREGDGKMMALYDVITNE